MAGAWVGDGLVQGAGHCCHPTALATGDRSVPRGQLHLWLPTFCLVGVWGKVWPFPCIAVLGTMDLLSWLGALETPRRKNMLTGSHGGEDMLVLCGRKELQECGIYASMGHYKTRKFSLLAK